MSTLHGNLHFNHIVNALYESMFPLNIMQSHVDKSIAVSIRSATTTESFSNDFSEIVSYPDVQSFLDDMADRNIILPHDFKRAISEVGLPSNTFDVWDLDLNDLISINKKAFNVLTWNANHLQSFSKASSLHEAMQIVKDRESYKPGYGAIVRVGSQMIFNTDRGGNELYDAIRSLEQQSASFEVNDELLHLIKDARCVVTAELMQDIDVSPDWLVMNASRPLIGSVVVHGSSTFLNGRFFAGIDPKDEFAKQNIERCLKDGGSVVIRTNQDILEAMALSLIPEEYRARYDALPEAQRNNTLKIHTRKLQNRPFGEMYAMYKTAALTFFPKEDSTFSATSRKRVPG